MHVVIMLNVAGPSAPAAFRMTEAQRAVAWGSGTLHVYMLFTSARCFYHDCQSLLHGKDIDGRRSANYMVAVACFAGVTCAALGGA